MLTPAYIPQASSPHPDVYRAVYDFVQIFSFTGTVTIAADNIYRGWENRSALPATSNEYAVITITDAIRRGTTTEMMPGTGVADDQPELYQLRTYYELTAQIDVCSDTDAARQRAYSLENAFRSLVGVDFFRKYGITAQWCNSVREMVFTDESSQFVKRYMLELHLAYWAGIDVGSAWFIDVAIERVEDVDAHHKP